MGGVTRNLLATVGDDSPLRLALSWASWNPFAVVMDIRREDGNGQTWEFARDLLEDGVHAPAGLGDIRIYPVSPTHAEIVLYPPRPYRLVMRVETAELVAFLAATWVDFLADIDFGEVTS